LKPPPKYFHAIILCFIIIHPLQVIIFIWQINLGSILHLLLVLFQDSLVNLNFRGSKGRSSDEFKSLIADKFTGKPTVGNELL
jgi:hypothetical protein